MENAYVPYQEGYDFGMGIKSSTGGRMQQGAKGVPSQVVGADGGSGAFQMTRLEHSSDLEDHLGISADASGGVGLFSASARFDFSKDCKIQTNSITLMLSCTQRNGFSQIARPELDEAAAPLVSTGQSQLFADRYGDCFVAGLETGGQFFGVIRIDVRSETDRQSMEASLSGSYGPFSADVSTKMQKAMTDTNSSAQTFLYYEGGNVQKKPQNPLELFQAADEWSKSVLVSPKPYTALLLPWVIANGPNPPNAADLETQRDVLKMCARMRSQVLDRQNVLEYMIDPLHSAEFKADPDPNRLAKLHAAISGDYDMIQEAASFAINNAKDARAPEAYARENKKIPDYAFTLLPTDLPKRVDGNNIAVPDFSQAPDYAAVQALAAKAGLTLAYSCQAPQAGQPFRVLLQDPGAGTPVSANATVKVFGNQALPPSQYLRLNRPLIARYLGVA